MSIEHDIYTMREDMREMRDLLLTIVERLPAKADNQPDLPDMQIPDQAWRRLKGILSFEEICIALEMEYGRKNQVMLGAEMKRRGVKQIKTKTQRLYSFPVDSAADANAMQSLRIKLGSAYKQSPGAKSLAEVAREIHSANDPETLSQLSRALRVFNIPRDGQTGKYLF